jgi:hypothetical protein
MEPHRSGYGSRENDQGFSAQLCRQPPLIGTVKALDTRVAGLKEPFRAMVIVAQCAGHCVN